jgi:lipoprotein-releasing system permease protein
MNFRLIVRIARALLMAHWRQTLVAAVGVTFGITMFIALLGFMVGLNELLDNMILNRTPHIRLFNEIKPSAYQAINASAEFQNSYNFIHTIKPANARHELYNSVALRKALEADPRIVGIAPKITAPVFFNDGAVDLAGVLNGIDVVNENILFHFNEYIVLGRSEDIDVVPNSIILGIALADKLRATVGDVVYITVAKGNRFALKVTGIAQSGLQEWDKTVSYTSLSTAQKILDKPNDYITDLQIRIHEISQAPVLAVEFSERFNSDAEDIQTSNAQFETGSFIRSLISYAVGITLLIVAGFGIYNILNMMIYEKMDSIAILKATGFSGHDVRMIFMVIALSIGLFGGLLGLCFGCALSYAIDQIPFQTSSLPTITTYPVSYRPLFYFIAASFSIITTYLAGWAPARKASKVDPVVIIRGK